MVRAMSGVRGRPARLGQSATLSVDEHVRERQAAGEHILLSVLEKPASRGWQG